MSRTFSAEEAEKSGLVARIFPAEKLLEETIKIAATIADYSLPIVMMAKESVNKGKLGEWRGKKESYREENLGAEMVA